MLNAKKENSFFWASSMDRGLQNLMVLWDVIITEWPEARLTIARNNVLSQGVLEEFLTKHKDSVIFLGKIEQNRLIKIMQESEYWLYPTDFIETYCMVALEAKKSGCICITSNLGALPDTIGDDGFLVEPPAGTIKYRDEVIVILQSLNRMSREEKRCRQIEAIASSLKYNWKSVGKAWDTMLQQDMMDKQ
jgi:glycosyltransferase involved in cell wall biosynthesis